MSNARPTDERRMAGWVGKALQIHGRIVSSENLTIDGTVEGTIELGDNGLTIGAGANVKADLAARTVVICGTVTGNVVASVSVDLQPTGSVTGDIVAPLFSMADGATVRGSINASGKAPARST
jgi:cytoskeletal protein CcmA (bactofilin family)